MLLRAAFRRVVRYIRSKLLVSVAHLTIHTVIPGTVLRLVGSLEATRCQRVARSCSSRCISDSLEYIQKISVSPLSMLGESMVDMYSRACMEKCDGEHVACDFVSDCSMTGSILLLTAPFMIVLILPKLSSMVDGRSL
jgi:hypothetical protein